LLRGASNFPGIFHPCSPSAAKENAMGFRSTFITQDLGGPLPDWFVEKWKNSLHFNEGNRLPISSKREGKYDQADELLTDLQKVLPWEDEERALVLVWLHECGGITRLEISKRQIQFSEPATWKRCDWPTHYNCFGCTDIKTLQERHLLE
jgi:hypothetical protein